jgi:asparagine synthase (glutamine-hydrolysing)
MCGIVGILDFGGSLSADSLNANARAMATAIANRGPDGEGTWADGSCGIALGHRRLSIIDLSELGRQPMPSADGRYVISFNGEIYNYQDLGRELGNMGIRFRGHSDTEVLVEAIAHWGFDGAIRRTNGMFALACWDRHERVLYLARDRLGEKPLYYGWLGRVFLFGSELKALSAYPGADFQIDRGALALFLRYNRVPAPYSIFKGVSKLLPATYLVVTREPSRDATGPREYWSAREAARQAEEHPFQGSQAEAVESLHHRLKTAVGMRMMSDVPLGAFLSGGIDSSAVVSMMQAQSSRPVRTFTIGFSEAHYDEADYARAVARHIGTDHTELYVTPEEALAVIPKLPTIYDEPFSDSSQVPTYLVCQLARSHVTVALSGDGGDEIFGGYDRYRLAVRLWRTLQRMPAVARRYASALIGAGPTQKLNSISEALAGIVTLPYVRPGTLGDKMQLMRTLLASASFEQTYAHMMSHWKNPTDMVPGAYEFQTPLSDPAQWPAVADPYKRLMALDTISYLPDDILTKVDRASMAMSLEARVPLLDHTLIEFAWTLPIFAGTDAIGSKWPLRRVLLQYVPRSLIDRPKKGFGVPIDAWLRGPLREWAEDMLEESRLSREGYFSVAPIRQRWEEHLSGRHNWHYYLWDVLMFQTWLASQ